MADEVRLLTADEIAAMRDELPHSPYRGSWERVLATLEALAEMAHERLNALIDAQAERDTWKAEAEDQRAAVARLEGDRDEWKAIAEKKLEQQKELDTIKLACIGETS